MIREAAKQVLKPTFLYRLLLRRRLGEDLATTRSLIGELDCGLHQDSLILVGTPLHTNLGDHLIALATCHFLEESFPDREVIEVPMEAWRLYGRQIAGAVGPGCQVLVSGGGWMGDLWPDDELTVQDVANAFPGNRVIVLPQTVFYDDPARDPGRSLLEGARAAYCGHGDLHLCLRERNSYEFAMAEFRGCDALLVPDMALAYLDESPKGDHAKGRRLGVCLRDDREASADASVVDRILASLEYQSYSPVKLSTMAPRRVSSSGRKDAVHEALSSFADCDLVLTDRLHGMLFSYLTDTPCIVLDNRTHKVSGVHDAWLGGGERLLMVRDEEDMDRVGVFAASGEKARNAFDTRLFDPIERLIDVQD